jgi:hypothetical protein
MFTGFWFGGPKLRDYWEDLGVGRRITLSWALEREGSLERTGFSRLRIGSRAGFCGYGDESSGSIKKAGYFLMS